MRRFLCLLLGVCGKVCAAPVTALAFHPGGAVLIAASGAEVRVCSPATGVTIETIATAGMRAAALAFSPDGARLAVGGGVPGEKGEVRVLDWPQKQWRSAFAAMPDLVAAVAFSPDGARLAIASADHTARGLALEEGGARLVERFVLRGHSGPVQAIAFSPDGALLVTASLDRSAKVWSAAEGRLLRSLGQHTEAIHALAFRPHTTGEPECATAGDDRTVRLWQPAIGRMMRIVRRHEGAILALAFAPDGRTLFSAGQEGRVREIDAGSDTVRREWPVSADWIHAVAISPDGRRLAAGDWMGRVSVRSVGD